MQQSTIKTKRLGREVFRFTKHDNFTSIPRLIIQTIVNPHHQSMWLRILARPRTVALNGALIGKAPYDS